MPMLNACPARKLEPCLNRTLNDPDELQSSSPKTKVWKTFQALPTQIVFHLQRPMRAGFKRFSHWTWRKICMPVSDISSLKSKVFRKEKHILYTNLTSTWTHHGPSLLPQSHIMLVVGMSLICRLKEATGHLVVQLWRILKQKRIGLKGLRPGTYNCVEWHGTSHHLWVLSLSHHDWLNGVGSIELALQHCARTSFIQNPKVSIATMQLSSTAT